MGGADQVQASNISKTYDEKKYFAAYFQDDWKITPSLTLNLGLRWDYFGPINETNGGQANFVPSGPPNGGPTFLLAGNRQGQQGIVFDAESRLTARFPRSAGQGRNHAPGQTDKYGNGWCKHKKLILRRA